MRIEILATQNINDLENFIVEVNKGNKISLSTKHKKYYIEVMNK